MIPLYPKWTRFTGNKNDTGLYLVPYCTGVRRLLFMTDYTKILSKGKKNSISSRELAVIMGFDNVRSLQADIAKSREAGQIILSSTAGGYFLPGSDEEIEEFIGVLVARAANTFKALKSAREYLNKTKGQMSFDDLEDFEYDI